MKKKIFLRKGFIVFILIQFLFLSGLRAQEDNEALPTYAQLKNKIVELMEKGKIPGLSLVIIKGNEPALIENFGYADLESKTPVTAGTRFELASCSKAFTALAALQLEENGQIHLDDPVSQYFPGFYVKYEEQEYDITLRQLLHHTSGIPWKTVSLIPPDTGPEALQKIVQNLVGIQLDSIPGKHYQYATINYDVIGAVIEKVTRQSFEDYMKYYVFTPLALSSTTVGSDITDPLMASGYKIGFMAPRKYKAPVYRGNYPAGYIVANSKDMARWLQIQLGLVETGFSHLIAKTHLRDNTVPPSTVTISSYGMGWDISLRGDKQISHTGANPNFTSYVAFRPGEKIAVAVLANSNSPLTTPIGGQVLAFLAGEKLPQIGPFSNKIDVACSIISYILGFFLLLTIALIVYTFIGAAKGKNKFEPLNWKKIGKFVGVLLLCLPYGLGIYLIPFATIGVPWETVFVWGPVSIYAVGVLMVAVFAVSILRFIISLLLPNKNKYLNAIPMIVLLGMLSGLANTAVLFIITTSFYSGVSIGYLLYYFALAFALHIFGAKIVTTKMIKMTNNLTLDLRTDLINKLISARNQNFEKLHDGRIFTTLNTDTVTIAGAAYLVIGAITNFITFASAFFYLTTISFPATMVVLLVVVAMTVYYYIISKISRRYLEDARDTQNVYMGLLNGLIKGFKELSMHFRKKKEYRDDVLKSCRRYCDKSIAAGLKFLNSTLIGSSFVMIILGVLSIVVPRLLTGVNTITLISYIMVLLYLLGPINGLMRVLPGLTQVKVAWDRIKGFSQALDDQVEAESVNQMIRKLNEPDSEKYFNAELLAHIKNNTVIESIKAEGLTFQYDSPNEEERFEVGPIDLEIKKGEALFITGGNGSGKTTLAKLLAGLYVPEKGSVKINGIEIKDTQLGEYYSTVLGDYHLFEKIYAVDLQEKTDDIRRYLELLELGKKVQIKGNKYSTINLSSGQRKRLALLQCFLEDRPIYLFDEFAANQDPEFRRFFYRELFVELKAKGKIIIAITHDDHYFDVADKLIKMDFGKLDEVGIDTHFTGKQKLISRPSM